MITSGMMTSKTPEWATPQDVFDKLNAEFRFTLDPCCTHQNAKCFKHYTREEDGLSKSWAGEIVFMNPPYGREIGLWMKKAYTESLLGATVVCLVPSRTDTAWWHDYAAKGQVRFVRGRLKFGNALTSAPFPSAIVIFEEKKTRKGISEMGIKLKKCNDYSKRWRTKADKAWSEAVKRRDRYKCIICGCESNLQSHHLIHRQSNFFRHNLENGVTLCSGHHMMSSQLSAHKTPWAFEKWMRENRPDQFAWWEKNRWKIMPAVKINYRQVCENLGEKIC
jgi:phage N-6-adenine-methyltransferase